jgi:hypothetical protein
MLTKQFGCGRAFGGDDLFTSCYGADEESGISVADLRIEARLPVLRLTQDSRALFQRVCAGRQGRPDLQPGPLVFSGLVAVDLGGDHDIADGDILHSTGDADE